MPNNLTIKCIRKTEFKNLYAKLIINQELSDKEKSVLLKLVVIFINEEEKHIKDFGYRVLLMYSNIHNDYKALFDISIHKGLIPVSKYIETNIYANNNQDSFFNLYLSAFMENFKKDNIYLTYQQSEIDVFLKNNKDTTVSIVAPTSYGKSGIIIDSISQNKELNICIIVPSKALLEQTRKRLLDARIKDKVKIVTHPEMYKESDPNTIAVLTQERLLRLLKKNKHLRFDIVFVDEAHNILNNDPRNILLASTLIILTRRNPSVKIKFLSPFLIDSNNLKLVHTEYQIQEFKVSEYIKSERLYVVDFRGGKEKMLKLYDQFIDDFFYVNKDINVDEIDFIKKHSLAKNIIYFNRPIEIEKFTREIIPRLPEINSPKIEKICEELKKHLHKEYYLIDAIRHGIIYHHGSVSSYIRLYIEYLFRNDDSIKYVITSSTLLEGVNIPAETLFVMNNKKGKSNLSPSQFRNLIGRVSRFSEVFSSQNKNLSLLEPKIFLVGSKYYQVNGNIEKFIKDCTKIDNQLIDDNKNPLLSTVEINDNNQNDRAQAENFIVNFEENIVISAHTNLAKTEIGKLCFENNIVEINILEKENLMDNIVKNYKSSLIKIDNPNSALKAISDIFVEFMKDDKDNNLKRLQNEKARYFYSKFLDWKINSTSYSEIIGHFLSYWEYIETQEIGSLVYVGSKWGEEFRGGHIPMWVDIRNKSIKQRVNLAIVRINDEQDFLDNVLFKFIDVLFELKIVEEFFYNNIKYGTSDPRKILLMKNGVSFSLTHLLIDKYIEYVNINVENGYYIISYDILNQMNISGENDIMIFEVEQHIVT